MYSENDIRTEAGLQRGGSAGQSQVCSVTYRCNFTNARYLLLLCLRIFCLSEFCIKQICNAINVPYIEHLIEIRWQLDLVVARWSGSNKLLYARPGK